MKKKRRAPISARDFILSLPRQYGPDEWVMFTKRTNDPKLSWLERQLANAGIEHRRHGESFHAPILEVRPDQLDAAWNVLSSFDDVEDDDPMFYEESTAHRAVVTLLGE
jgi:hypothetical protein